MHIEIFSWNPERVRYLGFRALYAAYLLGSRHNLGLTRSVYRDGGDQGDSGEESSHPKPPETTTSLGLAGTMEVMDKSISATSMKEEVVAKFG